MGHRTPTTNSKKGLFISQIEIGFEMGKVGVCLFSILIFEIYKGHFLSFVFMRALFYCCAFFFCLCSALVQRPKRKAPSDQSSEVAGRGCCQEGSVALKHVRHRCVP